MIDSQMPTKASNKNTGQAQLIWTQLIRSST